MSQFFTWLKRLLGVSTYQTSLEQYIASKHPESAADVEHWIREYDKRTTAGWAL